MHPPPATENRPHRAPLVEIVPIGRRINDIVIASTGLAIERVPRATRLSLLGLVLLGAVGIRAAYLEQHLADPDFRAPVVDPQFNDYWARALATGDWTPPPGAPDPEIRTAPYGRPPAYPHLLALAYRCFDGSYIAPRLIQIAIGLLNILLLYWLGTATFGFLPGLFAAALGSMYWALVYYEGELNAPSIEVCLSLLFLAALQRWGKSPSFLWPAAAGILLGFHALVRPNVLLLAGAAVLWFLIQGRKLRFSLTPICATCLVFTLTCAAIVAPVLLRNYRVSREFVLISSYGGVNAYIGNSARAEGYSARIPDLRQLAGMDTWDCFTYPQLVRGLGRNLGKPELSYAGASRYFYGRALDFWRNEPLAALRLTLKKALLFWGPAEVADGKEIALDRANSPILRHLPGFTLILSLALIGAGLLLTRSRQPNGHGYSGLLILLFVAGYFMSVLPFFISGRYRIPVAVALLLPAGYALAYWASSFRQRAWRYVVALPIAFAAAYGLCATPIVPYTPNSARWHMLRGVAYAQSGNATHAITELREATQLNPELTDAHLRLGAVLAAEGDFDGALSSYQKALWNDPGNPRAHNNLGFELARRGAYLEAERHYREALRINPAYTLAYNNLGIVFLNQDRLREALDWLERGIETVPDNADLLSNAGLALARLGRLSDAAEYYKRALAATPNHAPTLFNLAILLEHAGKTAEARRFYEQTLKHEPGHTHARDALSRITPAAPETTPATQ